MRDRRALERTNDRANGSVLVVFTAPRDESSESGRSIHSFIQIEIEIEIKTQIQIDRSIRVDGANEPLHWSRKARTIDRWRRAIVGDARWRFGEVVNGNPRQRYVTTRGVRMRAGERRTRRMGWDERECDRVVSISFEKMWIWIWIWIDARVTDEWVLLLTTTTTRA